MNWIILVLIAAFLWSVVAVIQKFVRVTYFENSVGYLIFLAPTALFVIPLFFFQKFTFLAPIESLLAISTGLLLAVGYYCYIEAMHKEEVSRVIILNIGASPIFVLIFSILFLKEILTIKQYIAFALILIGSILISFRKIEEKTRLTYGAILALLAGFFFAIQSIILKQISAANLTTMMVYREAGYAIAILSAFVISPQARKFTRKVVKDLNLRKTAIVYASEGIGVFGMFLYYLGVQKGPISLVSVVEGSETIFIFILTLIISVFIPKMFKEEIDKKTIIIKIASIILTISGLYLISA